MRHFAAPEYHHKLNFITFFQKLLRLFQFDHAIMLFDFRSQPHFLQDHIVLFLLGFVVFLFLLILPFAEVHDSANRWSTAWGDFHQIKADFYGSIQCVSNFDYADLIVILIDNANFRYANPFIDP